MQALAFALMWADQHPHWISVEDELPRSLNFILFTDGRYLYSGTYFGGRYYGDKGDFCVPPTLIDNVTHWMPLPAPPAKLSNVGRIGKDGL